MTRDQIFEIINANPVFHLATAEGDQPRVRGLLLYRADSDGFIFHTGAMKDLHRQLLANPKVEMCFFDPKSGVQVRVAGVAQEVQDMALKREIVNHPARGFLKTYVEQMGFDILSVFRVRECTAVTWTMAANFESKHPIRITGPG